MARDLRLALTILARDQVSKVLRKVLQDTVAQTKQAEQAEKQLGRSREQATQNGIRASRTLQQEVQRAAMARSTLGIRSERDIQREIALTQAAYNRLTRAGVMSANEQSRAFAAMNQQVSRLRGELAGTATGITRMQRGAGVGLGSAALAIGGGLTTAIATLYKPVSNQMSYEQRLAYMANTAFADRNITGRRGGMQEMDALIRQSVASGGGTKETAADALDAMLASGVVEFDSAKNLLPILQKYSTASGTSTVDLANIALTLKRNFGLKDSDIPAAMNMSIAAGQAGSFELTNMAKWLPQQLAAAGNNGMRGLDDFAVLLGLNQASATTAGSADEAGNNVVNLLAKITSQDAARAAAGVKFNGKGIDLPGSLARARSRGMNSLDAFNGIVDRVVENNEQYKSLEKKQRPHKKLKSNKPMNRCQRYLRVQQSGK